MLQQAEGARTKAGQLLEMYPDNEHLQLVLLASKSTGDQKTKKKKPIEILADLEGIQKAHPSSHSLSVLLAQLYAEEKRYSEATAVLESLLSISTNSVRHSPNKVFMLCSLHQKAGHPEESVKVLSEACAFWASTDPEASEYAELLKERAQQRLSGRQFAEAALDLELIVKRDPTDKVSLASLIRAYLEYAPAMAEKYASYLPPLPVSKSVDVARLESYADFVKPKAMA